MRPITRVGALVALLLLAGACASNPIRKAAHFSEELAKATERVQTTIMDEHARGLLPEASYQAFQATFVQMAKAGKALNAALRDLDGRGAYAQAQVMIGLVRRLLDEQVVKLDPTIQAYVAVGLEALRSTLMTIAALTAEGGA